MLAKGKNKDTPKVCSGAFRPILFNELHGEEHNTVKTTWLIYTQAKPDKFTCTSNITSTPAVYTCMYVCMHVYIHPTAPAVYTIKKTTILLMVDL